MPTSLLPKAAVIDVPKERVAREIVRILRERRLTQTEASFLIRDQPAVLSMIVNGRLRGFSLDRLVRYLSRLGCDVEVRIARRNSGPAGSKAGKVSVHVRG